MGRAAVLFAALLFFVVTACGGGDGGGSTAASQDSAAAAQLVADAADKTADAGTSRAIFMIEMSGLAAEPITMTGEGVFDSAGRRGRLTFDMSDLGGASGQDLGEAEMIFDDLVVYMRWPFLQEVNPSAKEWLRFDLEALGERQGFDLGQLSQLQQSDPSQALVYLRAANEVEAVGEEDVRGVGTTHYTMTVELAKVAEAAPPEQRAQVQASIDEIISKSGVREAKTDVWIDDEGLVRRQRIEYQNFRFAPGQEGDMAMTMELFDFGVEVDVTPPPEDEVTDITDLINGGA
jgi:hypothetical protein